MNTILTPQQANEVSKRLNKNQRLVLAGGCFDILHIGHVRFLEKAKKAGDILMVYVESDETIKKLKGPHRPIHTQQERAEILSSLRFVDYVILLPPMLSNSEYDNLALALKPAIIAATENDPAIIHKERQAKLIGAQIIFVTAYIPEKSSSMLVDILQKERI